MGMTAPFRTARANYKEDRNSRRRCGSRCSMGFQLITPVGGISLVGKFIINCLPVSLFVFLIVSAGRTQSTLSPTPHSTDVAATKASSTGTQPGAQKAIPQPDAENQFVAIDPFTQIKEMQR